MTLKNSSPYPAQNSEDSAWKTKLHDVLQMGVQLTRKPEPGLYLTATPIGNASDITLRALSTIVNAHMILCEDTRVTQKLFTMYGLTCQLMAYHDHSDSSTRKKIIKHLKEEKIIVLVTDAGTPLISDPGYKLITECITHNISVTTLPGACSPIAALTLSGLPTDRFLYAGFPPSKSIARTSFLSELKTLKTTLIFMESVHRLPASLTDMATVFGGARLASMCRELTKKFEEVRRGSLDELATHYADAGAPRGEVILIIAPPKETTDIWTEQEVDQMVQETFAKGAHIKTVAQIVAAASNWKKQSVYHRALTLKNAPPKSSS